MFAIELYRKYIFNSINGISNGEIIKRLDFERGKVEEIIKGLDTLFKGDKSLFDRNNRSIYTFIKQNILADAYKGNIASVIDTNIFFLKGLINEIDHLKLELVF